MLGFDVLQDLLQIRSYVYAEEPNIDIHNFIGTFTRVSLFLLLLSSHNPHFCCRKFFVENSESPIKITFGAFLYCHHLVFWFSLYSQYQKIHYSSGQHSETMSEFALYLMIY